MYYRVVGELQLNERNSKEVTLEIRPVAAPFRDTKLRLTSEKGLLSIEPSEFVFTYDNHEAMQRFVIKAKDNGYINSHSQDVVILHPMISEDKGYDAWDLDDVTITIIDDEELAWSVTPVNGGNLAENATTGAVSASITIDAELEDGVEYNLTFEDNAKNSYFNKMRYSLSPTNGFVPITADSTLSFNNKNQTRILYFLPVDNNIDEAEDNITYDIRARIGGQEARSLGSISVENNDVSGVTLTADTLTAGTCTGEISEESGDCTFNVSLSLQPENDVTVSVETTSDSRITLRTNTLTFNTGNWSDPQPVTLAIEDDFIAQTEDMAEAGDKNKKTITITANADSSESDLASVSTLDFTLINNDTAGIEIVKDDSTNPNTCIGGVSEDVAAGNCIFYVKLTSQPENDLTVAFQSTEDNRITNPLGVMFTAGDASNASNWSTPQRVTLAIADDEIAQSEETRIITITARTDGFTTDMFDFMLTSEDVADILFTDNTCTGEVLENVEAGNCTFNIKLASQPITDVTVSFTEIADSRVTAPTKTFTFTAGDWSDPQPVTLAIADDDIAQPQMDTPITVVATATGGYEGSSSFDFTLTNEDEANIKIVEATNNCKGTRSETERDCVFYVKLTSQPETPLTVAFNVTPDDSRITAPTKTFTFTAGDNSDWNTPQKVTLAIEDDDIAQISNPEIIIEATATGFTPASIRFTLTNEDTTGINLSQGTCLNSSNISESATEIVSCTFTVSLDSEPRGNVTVSFAEITDSRIDAPDPITFTAGDDSNWREETVILTIRNDEIAQTGDDLITIMATTSATGGYSQHSASFDFTLTNDDVLGINLASAGTKPCTGEISEEGGNCTFTVSLTYQPEDEVTVSFTTTTSDTRIKVPRAITFTAGDESNWRGETAELTIEGDTIAQNGNAGISIIASATGATSSNPLAFTLTNNDVLGITLATTTCTGSRSEADGNCTFTVSLTYQPEDIVTVSFTTTPTPTDSRITVPRAITFTAGNESNWRGQPVTLAIEDDSIIQTGDAPIITITASGTGGAGSAVLSFTLTNEDADTDGDGILDANDNCPNLANANQAADADCDGVGDNVDVDDDNDGLIEVSSLTMLHNMRNDLAGTSYDSTKDTCKGTLPTDIDTLNLDTDVKCADARLEWSWNSDYSGGTCYGELLTSLDEITNSLMCEAYGLYWDDVAGSTAGASRSRTSNCSIDSDGDGTFLCGYELTQNLDFDTNGDGTTFSGTCNVIMTDNSPRTDYSGCLLDADDNHDTYFPVASNGTGGWLPIGTSSSNSFTGIFDGNGHTISNMSVKIISVTSNVNAGLFSFTADGARIRNIGMLGG
ncbi:MAG: hypothetical protein K0U41_01355, partial [Gammaproteobacteria bacterium]|nr:hypothetical protein [Gammaproteobacteria bacterium]